MQSVRRGAGPAGSGDYREHRAARSAARNPTDRRAAQGGRQGGPGRFRHRLQQPGQPDQAAGRQHQAGPGIPCRRPG